MEQRFGPYLVGETVGRGNFAKVKLAIHEATGQKVALKIIPRKTVESDPKFDGKIRREIGILRLLRHPHIMRLYDVIKTRSDIVLVLEYVGGGELFEHLARHGRLEESAARRLFQQLVSGVAYCHRFNVAHRDLKPENLTLTHDGNLKIGDFGLSGLMRDGVFFGTSCGTPNYAAPEVVSGRLYSGREADVWSAGVVLFTMLCGRLPFDEDYVQVLFKKIQRASYVVPAHVSPLARDLLQRLLVVNPLERATLEQIARHPWVAVGFPSYLLRAVLGSGSAASASPGGASSLGSPATPMSDAVASPSSVAASPIAADEEVVGEVARRLRIPMIKVHSIVTAKLAAARQQQLQQQAHGTPYFGTSPEPSPATSPGTIASPVATPTSADEAVAEEQRNVFVAYSILADRKLFGKLQRDAYVEQSAAASISAAGSVGAPASTQSLGAFLAANSTGTYGSLPVTMSSTPQSISLTHTKSPAYEMPPVPNNIAGLPEFVEGTVSVAQYNARSSGEVPRFDFKPRTSAAAASRDGGNDETPPLSAGSPSRASSGAETPPQSQPHSPLHPPLASMPPPPDLDRSVEGKAAAAAATGAAKSTACAARVPPQPFRCGVMFDTTNAKIAMEHLYVAMQQTGLLWKAIAPFSIIAVAHSPQARLYITLFRRNATQRQFIVDIWGEPEFGFGALDVLHELHRKLLVRARSRMTRVDPTNVSFSNSSSPCTPPTSILRPPTPPQLQAIGATRDRATSALEPPPFPAPAQRDRASSAMS